ncbi:hypothetical protein MPTK1_8g12970 [Marchantia polymorpha subsp. ruderalis]|uniref:Protein root UVB sensitive 6 n=2 Tax=Marchantia polymorpha TaxID=3197 RepID=A0A176W5H9_MARPO|nr:hypothetical protein AXG93_223s1200 [Marchantia polymorpha subsp. ruderalis]PTQ34055.1 hypothetical protein MARPO_0083s0024 [Marchantia polymorpha]BBN19712.1 hypothetical protein Mp_8g12970 [Marchantia polymorpha subsp. ruderalis]|eukprot:PTQ34055.1 hypothetical protein MARPO_0083s0024 [Marchantia polymorpha]
MGGVIFPGKPKKRRGLLVSHPNPLSATATAGPEAWPELRNLSKSLAVLSTSRDPSPASSSSSSSSSTSRPLPVDSSFVCRESLRGVQWQYSSSDKGSLQPQWNRVGRAEAKRDHLKEAIAFLRSHVVPEGYPASVSPAYTPYMQWRAVQYFFGGAMSVFTTRSLLHALGISRKGSASGAVAVNWVIKDGAGRVGRMIFARHGKKFDCHLKQLRFAGDLLMELGAGVELATMAFPQLFLPLACAASVAKNVAAVTSTSTRAPIYKAFARAENIGDVTAKGECISNIADLFGTGLGILLSKKNPSLFVTFLGLSCGYIISSFQEVKAVRLPTLNRARFAVAAQVFLDTGQVPSLEYANAKENILFAPWAEEKSVALGARVMEAFSTPEDFKVTRALFEKENYLLTYRPSKRRAFVVLKETARSEDILRATFHAHVLMQILRQVRFKGRAEEGDKRDKESLAFNLNSQWQSEDGVIKAVAKSYEHVDSLFGTFKEKASAQGWIMAENLLSPGDARVSI